MPGGEVGGGGGGGEGFVAGCVDAGRVGCGGRGGGCEVGRQGGEGGVWGAGGGGWGEFGGDEGGDGSAGGRGWVGVDVCRVGLVSGWLWWLEGWGAYRGGSRGIRG